MAAIDEEFWIKVDDLRKRVMAAVCWFVRRKSSNVSFMLTLIHWLLWHVLFIILFIYFICIFIYIFMEMHIYL